MALVFVGSNPTVHPILIRVCDEIMNVLRKSDAMDSSIVSWGDSVPLRAFKLYQFRKTRFFGQWIGALTFLLALTAIVACASSDDSERLAAQRLFRNFLIQEHSSAEADVRIQGMVDELPPDFPKPDGLELLGSAFTDTDDSRELIVGWQSLIHADALYDFFRKFLNEDPWSIDRDPQVRGIDFLSFLDIDRPGFRGELRINQEGRVSVIILRAWEILNLTTPPSQNS